MWDLRVVALAAVLASLAALPATADQCYLEGGTCALCWTTDSAGVKVGPERCPASVSSSFETELPPAMYSGERSAVRYSVHLNTSDLRVVPVADENGELRDITHSNIHSCFSGSGICTPFVANSPGLSTHTPEMWSQLDDDGRAEFETQVKLDQGFYMIIAHSRFHTLDDAVDEPEGGCDGKDCHKVYDVAIGAPHQVLPSLMSPSRRCYLRNFGPKEDCALCWITESSGIRRMEVCPEELIVISQDLQPPSVMVSHTSYQVSSTIKLDAAALGLAKTDTAAGLVDISHANYHSCRTKAGSCTPFVKDTPELSTHSPAVSKDLDATGEMKLEQDLNLSPGKYQVITHFRFKVMEEATEPCGSAKQGLGKCPLSTYDVAVGTEVTVLPPESLSAFSSCEQETCQLCWVNDWQGRTRVLSPCPSGILPSFVEPPPKHLFSSSAYDLKYALEIDPRFGVVPGLGGDRSLVTAAIAACPMGSVTCGPMLGPAQAAPGEDGELPGVMEPGKVSSEGGGRTAFRSKLTLPPGAYTMIVHYQFYATEGSSGVDEVLPPHCSVEGTRCLFEYNVAIGMNREVLELPPGALENDGGSQGMSAELLTSLLAVAAGLALIAVLAAAYTMWSRRRRRNGEAPFCCGRASSGEFSLPTQGNIVINVAPGGNLTVNSNISKKLVRHTSMRDAKNLKFGSLAQPVVDLHEGLDDDYRNLPMRFLLASHVRSAKKLLCYEEMTNTRCGFVDIPYSKTTQNTWDRAAVVSWRWSKAKPATMRRGFSPLSDMQLAELQAYLELNKKIEYVWLDWSCVPQYLSSPMFEVARSKLFYSRARTMIVLPTLQDLPSGDMRVVLMSIIRRLTERLTSSPSEQPSSRAGSQSSPESGPLPEPVASQDSVQVSLAPPSREEPPPSFDGVSCSLSRSGPSFRSTRGPVFARQESFLAADFAPKASASTSAKRIELAARRSSNPGALSRDKSKEGRGTEDAAAKNGRRREDVILACHILMKIRDRGTYSEFSYFGRVWTLAERMARHGRQESLCNWLNLEAWLGMTLDALWQASDPNKADNELPGLAYCWGRIFDAEKTREVIRTLSHVRERGSNLASDWVTSQVAELFVDAVQVWRTAFVTEALDVPWLRNYLLHDAGRLYQSWHPEDMVFAIFTFFCWHVRDEFPAAHRDLCLLSGINESESLLWPVAAKCMESAQDAANQALGPYGSNGSVRASAIHNADNAAIGFPVTASTSNQLMMPITESPVRADGPDREPVSGWQMGDQRSTAAPFEDPDAVANVAAPATLDDMKKDEPVDSKE